MANPILEKMGKTSNNISGIIDMMRGKSPADAVTAMCNSNPAFRDFYDRNKNRPIDDVCKDYGINPVALRQMLK